MHPHQLNSATPDAAEAVLLTCCGSRRWARRVAAHRPYPDLEALLAASDEAAYDLSDADLTEALACEPLNVVLPHASQVPHQGAPRTGHTAAHTALHAAHAAYESRFGHTFVICLDDVPADEALDQLLAGIRSRLGNDPEDERAIAAEELRRLARGRLARFAFGNTPGHTTGHTTGRTRGTRRTGEPIANAFR
ncbi:2-oxo-4-hydroxy-4-carboxy-5-ureidoimidazoline decarboxylase [Streptomyces sp. NPDC004732]|uniref:2-oxo-4-hydroxy-4-carboxy-5-ureidoimidazoline decarboxylase n=1 Tax=Streptomyces sp. NPDC004732 TaxID=3154290 RepID=UPI0033AFF817